MTVENKHTPGPWCWWYGNLIGPGGEFEHCVIEMTHDGMRFPDDEYDKEKIPNARLIAAAPELLEALKSLCLAVEGSARAFPGEYMTAMRVIAKATGSDQ